MHPLKITATALSLCCVVAEAILLRNELIDCLPYKEMQLHATYGHAADIATLLGLLTVPLASALVPPQRPIASVLVLVLLAGITPLLFLAVVYSLAPPSAYELALGAPTDFSTTAAWRKLRSEAFFVAAVGGLCSLLGATALVRFHLAAQRDAA